MGEATGVAGDTLERLHSMVDELRALPFDLAGDDELIEFWRALETVGRRLEAVEHHLINEVDSRGLAFRYGERSMTTMTRTVLRIGIGAARIRVAAAEAAGPRRTFTGERLPAVFPIVAEAQAAGTVSNQHARIITGAIEALPDDVRSEQGEWSETFLTTQAQILDPDALRTVANRLREVFDPNGVIGDPDYRERRREFELHVRPDGSARLSGEATAELTERLQVLFDTLARPVPAADGMRDMRLPAQRRHDAVLQGVRMAQRAELLPDSGGVEATLILTAAAADWQQDTGTARTGHGIVLSTGEAKRWLSGDTRVLAVTLDQQQAITAYSGTHRIFSRNQRLAMHARDQGCVFPGCDAAPQRCEAHHVTEFADGGPTLVENGALLCSFHHREHQRLDWQTIMLDGTPHLVPPRWVDAAQTPVRNRAHDPARDLLPAP